MEGPTLMMQIARSWRVTVAGLAVGVVGVLGLACPIASADPVLPPRPNPAPVPAPRQHPLPGQGGRCPRGPPPRRAGARPSGGRAGPATGADARSGPVRDA